MRCSKLAGSLVALSLSLAAFVVPETVRADDGTWEVLRNESGIVVSRKEIPGSAFVAFRGEGDVHASLLEVADVLVDVPHESEWMDSVRDARIVRKVTDSEYIMYSHVATPSPLTDRDFVADVHVAVDAARHVFSVEMRSVDDGAAPTTSYVRGLLTGSTFTLRGNPDGTTHVIAEIHCDPKGSIPGWAVNFFQKSWGYNTIKGLRRQVAQGTAPVNPLLKEKLAP